VGRDSPWLFSVFCSLFADVAFASSLGLAVVNPSETAFF
jgi:hypothetical protein